MNSTIKNKNICQCGREIPQNHYSTIQAKKCPSCTYKEAVSKKNNRKTKAKTKQFDFYSTPAWKWFRRYVLLYYANKDGIVKCATSGRLMVLGSKNCHCGHYIKVRDDIVFFGKILEEKAMEILEENWDYCVDDEDHTNDACVQDPMRFNPGDWYSQMGY